MTVKELINQLNILGEDNNEVVLEKEVVSNKYQLCLRDPEDGQPMQTIVLE